MAERGLTACIVVAARCYPLIWEKLPISEFWNSRKQERGEGTSHEKEALTR